VLVEPVFPELVQAPAAVDATQGQHVFCAGKGPKHAGLFAAGSDDGFAAGFHDAGANEIA